MNPLLQLERELLNSQLDKNATEGRIPSDNTAEVYSDADEAEEKQPEIIAVNTYPDRECVTEALKESQKDRTDSKDRKDNAEFGTTRTSSAVNNRSIPSSKKSDDITEKTEANKEVVHNVISRNDKKPQEVKKSRIDSTAHKLSPLERMILRQEALLMRQNEKFLDSIKGKNRP